MISSLLSFCLYIFMLVLVRFSVLLAFLGE